MRTKHIVIPGLWLRILVQWVVWAAPGIALMTVIRLTLWWAIGWPWDRLMPDYPSVALGSACVIFGVLVGDAAVRISPHETSEDNYR